MTDLDKLSSNNTLVQNSTSTLIYKNEDEEEIEDLDETLLGDLNRDGRVDYKDLVILKNYLNGDEELTEEQSKAADVNQDGVVNQADYYLLFYGITERDKAEDKVRELQDLYVSLVGNKYLTHVVVGVDNSNINAVKAELASTKAYLAVLDSLI